MNTSFHISEAARNRLLVVSGFSFLLTAKSEVDRRGALDLAELKKERLEMEPYVLEGDEAVNFPWNDSNLDEWLYRPIIVKGRPIFRHSMYIQNDQVKAKGSNWIVPLVTQEPATAARAQPNGILLNLGWMPGMYTTNTNSNFSLRVSEEQEYMTVLTTGEDLKRDIGSRKSNSWSEQHFSINEFDLGDMARASGFKNQKKMKYAYLERYDADSAKNADNVDYYNRDPTIDFPYVKTYSGIVNMGPSPWEIARREKMYFGIGSVTGLIAIAAKVL